MKATVGKNIKRKKSKWIINKGKQLSKYKKENDADIIVT